MFKILLMGVLCFQLLSQTAFALNWGGTKLNPTEQLYLKKFLRILDINTQILEGLQAGEMGEQTAEFFYQSNPDLIVNTIRTCLAYQNANRGLRKIVSPGPYSNCKENFESAYRIFYTTTKNGNLASQIDTPHANAAITKTLEQISVVLNRQRNLGKNNVSHGIEWVVPTRSNYR